MKVLGIGRCGQGQYIDITEGFWADPLLWPQLLSLHQWSISSLNTMSLLTILWVPIRISHFPVFTWATISLISFAVRKRFDVNLLYGKIAKSSLWKYGNCCISPNGVGLTNTGDLLFDHWRFELLLESANLVYKPTSRRQGRSLDRIFPYSDLTSWVAIAGLGVSS